MQKRATALHDYGKLVSIPLQRRLTTIMAGIHQGLRAGTSHEFLDMEEYKAGDPVTDIDWKATARHNRPIVKRFESAATLTAYLLVDTGNTMAAAAKSGETKKEVAVEFVTAISWLTALRGDHLGLVAGNVGERTAIPARSGVSHAEKILRVSESASVRGAGPDVGRLVARARVGTRSRSILFLITDHFQITGELAASLRKLKPRHKVFVFLIEDFDPTAQPGTRDVQGGLLPNFLASDRSLQSEWADARQALMGQAELRLKQQGIPFATAGSRAEVLPALQLMGKGTDG